MPERELGTTAYFLLALLGLGSWSAYELAEQMKRGFQYIWPKAERAFYYEAIRLAEGGFATAETSPVGERPRVVYSITHQGREALAEWLADREPDATRLESEVLGRIFFSEYGTVADLRAATERVIDDGKEVLRIVVNRSRVYLSDGSEFPHRLHLIALAGKFLCDYGSMLVDYGTWVEKATADWKDTTPEGKTEAALEIFRGIEADASARLGSPARQASR